MQHNAQSIHIDKLPLLTCTHVQYVTLHAAVAGPIGLALLQFCNIRAYIQHGVQASLHALSQTRIHRYRLTHKFDSVNQIWPAMLTMSKSGATFMSRWWACMKAMYAGRQS